MWYWNVTLRGPARSRVVHYLDHAHETPRISETVAHITVLYGYQAREAQEASRVFHCVAWATWVCDDDLFAYALFESGQLIDEYESSGVNHNGADGSSLPIGGNAVKLCEVFGVNDAITQVEAILRTTARDCADTPSYRYAAEHVRHHDLCLALGLPPMTYPQ